MFSTASLVGMGASSAAGRAVSDAYERAAKLTKNMYREGEKRLTPYTEVGGEATDTYATALGLRGRPAQTQFYEQFQTDPGFQTGLNRAMDLTTKRYALLGRTGGGLSNALLKVGQSAMYDQYQRRLGHLQGLSGQGQQAATNIANMGMNYATTAGNFMGKAGQARAQGIIGRANASIAGLRNLGNYRSWQRGRAAGSAGSINRAF
jgi:hypothetical protein